MNIILDEDAIMPSKAHEADAGFDLYSREEKTISARSSALFDTGVHIQLPKCTVGFLKSKSGLNVKHGVVSEGVIDSGYTGSIVAKLYNNSDNDYVVKKGDKITQLVILPIISLDLNIVSKLEESSRGNNGFGSSGR